MTTVTGSISITAPAFFVDLVAILPGAFVLGSSELGGPDVLGGPTDTLAETINIVDFGGEPIRKPPAIIASIGVAASPSTGLLQAIAGIAFCNTVGSAAQLHLLTAGGTEIVLTATYNGRTNVFVGTA